MTVTIVKKAATRHHHWLARVPGLALPSKANLLSPTHYTGWFSGQVTPYRPGWYEVRMGYLLAPHPNSKAYLQGRFRYFDGKLWRAGWLGQEVSIFGQHPSHQWRGLTQAGLAFLNSP